MSKSTGNVDLTSKRIDKILVGSTSACNMYLIITRTRIIKSKCKSDTSKYVNRNSKPSTIIACARLRVRLVVCARATLLGIQRALSIARSY